MRINTKRLAAAGGALIVTLGVARLGAQGSSELRVYKGEAVGQVGLTLAPWGSGEVRESEDKVYVGSKSIRVTTHGRYQGARIVLQNPVDLKPVASDPNAYLQLTVALANRDSTGSFGLGQDYGLGGRSGGPAGIGGALGGAPGGGRPGGPGADLYGPAHRRSL